jgi:SAM-dependent methyltransferase
VPKHEHQRYESKYRAYYDAGIEFVSKKGYDDDYRALLESLPQPARLIECGCGEGFAAAMAADIGFDVLGIDGAPSAVAKATATHCDARRKLKFEIGDATNLDQIESVSFDVVVDIGCLHMIGDLEDANRYLAHAYRILKPGGRAFFQNLVSSDEAKRWYPKMAEWINEQARRSKEFSGKDTERQVFTVDGRRVEVDVPIRLGGTSRDLTDYNRLLTYAGFKVVSALVKYPGVNSPFEAVIVAGKGDGAEISGRITG